MTTTIEAQYQDTYIREVRATYHRTNTATMCLTEPEQAAAFVRSVLTDMRGSATLFILDRHAVGSVQNYVADSTPPPERIGLPAFGA
ncbi:MAG: hypothetical protein R3E01_01790 [Pirellulaceae bacterium]